MPAVAKTAVENTLANALNGRPIPDIIAVVAPSHPLAQSSAPVEDVQLSEHTNIVLSDHADTLDSKAGLQSHRAL